VGESLNISDEERKSNKYYLYNIGEQPKNKVEFTLYVIQWIAYSSGAIITVPLILGLPFGLEQMEIAALMQRIFFYSGLATLLQIYLGHGVPLVEGPSSLWWAVMASLATAAANMGMELFELRSHIEFSLIISGVMIVTIAKIGLFDKIQKYFTPILTGTALVLLPLQASRMFIIGMLGVTEKGPDLFISLTSFIVITIVIYISVKTTGFIQSISVLIGIFVGWLIFGIFGRIETSNYCIGELVSFPRFLAWGTPTFELGIFITQLAVSLISITISIASIKAALETLGIYNEKLINKGLLVNGISTMLAGFGASVGTTPFATSIGLIKISRVASIFPFKVFSIVMMLLGFLPAVSIAISTIPPSVAYSVFVISMGTLLCVGLKEYTKLAFKIEEMLVIGISMIVGVGIIALPKSTFICLPNWIAYIVSNGMIVGVFVCFLLENLINTLIKSDRIA